MAGSLRLSDREDPLWLIIHCHNILPKLVMINIIVNTLYWHRLCCMEYVDRHLAKPYGPGGENPHLSQKYSWIFCKKR